MKERSRDPYNVLFLCTGNSARSIMAEAILDRYGRDKFHAFSAGSDPKGQVHPLTLEILTGLNYETGSLRSKSWDEFSGGDAPDMDFVFTVCDRAAGEACPVWAGRPMTIHWGVDDPARSVQDLETARRLFKRAYTELEGRIKFFTALPLDNLDRAALQSELEAIGVSPGVGKPEPA